MLLELTFPAMELYAMPAATQTLLDGATVDVDAWHAEKVETAFAELESIAFVTGNGVGRPGGFLAYQKRVENDNQQPGQLGFIGTRASGAFPASNPANRLFDLVYTLKAGYRQNAGFVIIWRVHSTIRKFKDAEGNYLWAPPLAAKLISFPVMEAEAMSDLGASSLSLALGAFRLCYLVVDLAGLRTLSNSYSAKSYVLSYTTKRIGGGIQDLEVTKC